MDISSVLESGDVLRFHAVPGMTPQKLSEHQWGVAVLLEYLYDKEVNKNHLMYALTHDCTEMITGDIPATIKWQEVELANILKGIENKFVAKWGINYADKIPTTLPIKICDCLEGMNYCLNRVMQGEIAACSVFWKWSDFLNDLDLETKAVEFKVHLTMSMEYLGYEREKYATS